MTMRIGAGIGLVGLTVALSGCSGSGYVSTPVAPSPVPTQAVIAPPTSAPASWLAGYTLTGVSLSGVVYEETPTGRVGIGGAPVYCEMCGEITHTWAIADANGFYRFPGDLATGGGVWLRPGTRTVVMARTDGYQDPPGVPLMFNGTGWREVLIGGDTRFDIQLVRR